jgi:hypothetical protein
MQLFYFSQKVLENNRKQQKQKQQCFKRIHTQSSKRMLLGVHVGSIPSTQFKR